MPKITNVTDAEIADMAERLIDLRPEIQELTDKMRALRFDPMKTPAGYARSLSGMAMVCSDLAAAILTTMQMDEDRKQLEASLRERITQ